MRLGIRLCLDIRLCIRLLINTYQCLSMLIELRSDHSFHNIREGMLSGLSCLRSTSLLRNSCPMVHTSVFSYYFESLDTVSVEFLPCISRLQKVPGTNFITQWDVLVHLLLTYYSVTLLKTILSCRFIYLLHLPNSHQWICLRLITSSQIPFVIL
jgi:hypothetical protein